ncbi:hypothetical protein IE53DRAFT_52018 [Violaceomyces palustris]|uniref:Uncharacterized protein n=1 Tax=Violaceomyces palustris TaxID=1673888 RepID=A0ACD0NZY8_9BASI|nr:hypothetical protein IE53DRAFT_52018 [Violaceomyces palustris]
MSTGSPSISSLHQSSGRQSIQVSVIGTLPSKNLDTLLNLISVQTGSTPTKLHQYEHVLSRNDDESSKLRESQDNAWKGVFRARESLRLRCRREKVGLGGGDVKINTSLFLPLQPLPSRQYPKTTVRSVISVDLLEEESFRPGSESWIELAASLGWVPGFSFLRSGLRFIVPSTQREDGSAGTTFNEVLVYKVFRNDPTGYTDDLVGLDTEAHTVVVQVVSTVGFFDDDASAASSSDSGDAKARQTASVKSLPLQGGGQGAPTPRDQDDSLDKAVKHVETMAKLLRGVVDLAREDD